LRRPRTRPSVRNLHVFSKEFGASPCKRPYFHYPIHDTFQQVQGQPRRCDTLHTDFHGLTVVRLAPLKCCMWALRCTSSLLPTGSEACRRVQLLAQGSKPLQIETQRGKRSVWWYSLGAPLSKSRRYDDRVGKHRTAGEPGLSVSVWSAVLQSATGRASTRDRPGL